MARNITADYISGFVDGEGCFNITLRKDKGKYFYWKANFVIEIRKDDRLLLSAIKEFFRAGTLCQAGECARYQVSDTQILLDKIIPFFEKNSLIGKKKNDFILWKEAVEIIGRNKKKKNNSEKGLKGFQTVTWNQIDLKRLKAIRNEMLVYKGGGKSRVFKHQGS